MKQAKITALEEQIGHTFSNRELLEQALTHSSHAGECAPHAAPQRRSTLGQPDSQTPVAAVNEEHGSVRDNEQLEFLGDAVLGFVTSQELFRRFPDYTEGELSKLRAHLVSARHLVHAARELELGDYLRLGRGEEKSGGRTKAALLVDALEAVVAALFLDAGLEFVRRFLLERVVNPELEKLEADGKLMVDYKSELQERLHACGRAEPQYLLVAEAGPAHHRIFTMETRILDESGQLEFAARGQGTTKKRAGQAAAREALQKLSSSNHETEATH